MCDNIYYYVYAVWVYRRGSSICDWFGSIARKYYEHVPRGVYFKDFSEVRVNLIWRTLAHAYGDYPEGPRKKLHYPQRFRANIEEYLRRPNIYRLRIFNQVLQHNNISVDLSNIVRRVRDVYTISPPLSVFRNAKFVSRTLLVPI